MASCHKSNPCSIPSPSHWFWPTGATGPTGPIGLTGSTGAFSGILYEDLLPNNQGISLGSSSSTFENLFVSNDGSVNLGSVSLTTDALEGRSRQDNYLSIGASARIRGGSVALAREGETDVILRNTGRNSARLYSSLTLQGNLSFGVLDDLIPPVTIANNLGKLELPAGTTLAGVPLSPETTGPTGPRGQDSSVTGPTGSPGQASQTTGPTGPPGPSTGLTGPTGPSSLVTGPTGPTGSTGADSTVTGPTGPTGFTGADSTVTGPTGPTGFTGADSTVTGPTGPTGFTGADSTVTGPTGPTGFTGADSTVTGPTGPTGFTGADSTVTGPTGPTGFTGADSTVTGPTGPTGFTGADSTVTGPTGPTGFTGSDSTVTGPTGPTGFTGADSTVTGPTGPTGFTGADSTVTGPTGPTGFTGADSTVTGPTGPTGFTGADSTVTGPTGPTGFTGSDSTVTGPTGPTGFTGADSTVTGPTGPTGFTGADSTVTGPTGPTGFTGADSTITGPTGPTGFTGPGSIVTGPTGPTGFTGADSTVTGPTGPTGFTGADSTVTGPTGPTGFTGADSTVTGPTGPTGFTGSDSTVTGPTGPTGFTGPGSIVTGPTGPTGFTGADSTVTGPTGPTGFTGADSSVTGPTGPTGSVSSLLILGANNIDVDNTIPNQSTVRLQSPLTAAVNAGEQTLYGQATDTGVTWTWTTIASTATSAAQYVAFTQDTNTGNDNSGALSSTATDVKVDLAYQNGGRVASTVLSSELDQGVLAFTVTDGASNSSTRTITVTPASVEDDRDANNGTSAAQRNELLNPLSGSNETLTFSSPGSGVLNTQVTQTTLNQASRNQQYSQAFGAQTVSYLSELLCSNARSRLQLQHSDTGGGNNVTHNQSLETSGSAMTLTQAFNNTAIGSRTSTIQTAASGLAVTSDNAVAITAGGGASLGMNANATLFSPSTVALTSSLAGSIAAPNFVMQATSGNPAAYPAVRVNRTGVNSTPGQVVGALSYWAPDGSGTSMEWARVQARSDNVGVGNQDSTLSLYSSVNGVPVEAFNCNGGQNDNNSFQNLDMNGNSLTTSTGGLTLSSSSSATAGATLTLATKNNVAGSGAGLVLTGNTLLATSHGGNSGQHLCLTINGVVYKISLLAA